MPKYHNFLITFRGRVRVDEGDAYPTLEEVIKDSFPADLLDGVTLGDEQPTVTLTELIEEPDV